MTTDNNDYIIPDEELALAKEIFKNACVDLTVNTSLQVTTRKKTYSGKYVYSGPNMEVLKNMLKFDTSSWIIMNKLLATIDTYQKMLKPSEEPIFSDE